MGRRAGTVVVGLVVVALAAGCGRGVRDATEVTSPPDVATGAPRSSFSALASTVRSIMEANAIPGAVVLVRDGREAWTQAFGTRGVGEDDPVSVFDHFRVGSNTKTMVGTVILQLAEEGSIALDDPVSRYRPDVPNGDDITIAQLLDMRSGLATYTDLEWFNAILDDDPTRVWDPEELAAIGLALPVLRDEQDEPRPPHRGLAEVGDAVLVEEREERDREQLRAARHDDVHDPHRQAGGRVA